MAAWSAGTSGGQRVLAMEDVAARAGDDLDGEGKQQEGWWEGGGSAGTTAAEAEGNPKAGTPRWSHQEEAEQENSSEGVRRGGGEEQEEDVKTRHDETAPQGEDPPHLTWTD